jgi:preprotein translocase subunit SecF
MDEFKQELVELKGFIADLKQDRAATKAKEKREGWTKYTSLSIVIIAVFAAIATQWGGKYSSRTLVALNKSTLKQGMASDAWGYYQAKSIKQRVAQSERDLLIRGIDTNSAAGKKELAAIEAKIAKYDAEMTKITDQAKALEKERDDATGSADHSSLQGGAMGGAVSIFSIAIALGSICLVVKKKWLWFLAIALALAAVGQMIHAWTV